MALSVTLTDQQKQKLQPIVDASDKSNIYLIAIKNLSEGHSFTDVAKLFLLTPEELKTAVEGFQKDGLEAFSRKKWYKRRKTKDTPSDPPEDKPGTNSTAHEPALTEKQKAELKGLLKGHGYSRFIKILTILKTPEGEDIRTIARVLDINIKTAQRYVTLYKKGGVSLLLKTRYRGSKGSLSKAQEQELASVLRKDLGHHTTKQVRNLIKERFGVTYSKRGVCKLLRRLAFRSKLPNTVPAKCDPEKQRTHLEDLAALRKKHPDGRFLYVDCAHPHVNPKLKRGWIHKDDNVAVPVSASRARLNIIGAYDADNGDSIFRTHETINSGNVCSFLNAIRRKFSREKIFLILDNASYFSSEKTQEYAEKQSINLVYLPPYSPNLNLIERFWGLLHRDRAFLLHQTKEDFHRWFVSWARTMRFRKEELFRLITYDYQTFDKVKILSEAA